MNITRGKLGGVAHITFEPREDARGFFMRIYDKKLFETHGIHREWVEESQSFTKLRGTVRGLRFQYPPHAEAKLVRLWSGEAFVVAVDLRKGSPTMGQWEGVVLAEGRNMLFVPRGFAMGMCTVTDDCHLHYRMDTHYHPESQGAIRWDDPDLKIIWPVARAAAISERDMKAMSFQEFVQVRGGLLT